MTDMDALLRMAENILNRKDRHCVIGKVIPKRYYWSTKVPGNWRPDDCGYEPGAAAQAKGVLTKAFTHAEHKVSIPVDGDYFLEAYRLEKIKQAALARDVNAEQEWIEKEMQRNREAASRTILLPDTGLQFSDYAMIVSVILLYLFFSTLAYAGFLHFFR